MVEQFRFSFALEDAADVQNQPRFNIAPTQNVLTVTGHEDRRLGHAMRWGLVPFWAKDLSIGARMINARSETVHEKPAFSEPFKSRRCLILADGYYEWKKEGKAKQPYFFRMRDDSVFAFAGLWASWRAPDETKVLSCTILTTEPNEIQSPIHDRMPVVLADKQYDAWLDPTFADTEQLLSTCRPFPVDSMQVEAVSRHVNNANNDDPGCIEPAKTQSPLFDL